MYTKFVKADVSAPPAEADAGDGMDVERDIQPNITSLRTSSEMEFQMDFPDWDGIDADPTTDNQENEPPQVAGSSWKPWQYGVPGSRGGRTPLPSPDVAR